MKQFNLDEYLKHPSRKVVTRDGSPAEIKCTNYYDTQYPVIAEIDVKGVKMAYRFQSNGISQFIGTDIYELFFVPEKKVGWTNIYVDSDNNRYSGCWIFKSKEEGEKCGKSNKEYLTTIRIEWEDYI